MLPTCSQKWCTLARAAAGPLPGGGVETSRPPPPCDARVACAIWWLGGLPALPFLPASVSTAVMSLEKLGRCVNTCGELSLVRNEDPVFPWQQLAIRVPRSIFPGRETTPGSAGAWWVGEIVKHGPLELGGGTVGSKGSGRRASTLFLPPSVCCCRLLHGHCQPTITQGWCRVAGEPGGGPNPRLAGGAGRPRLALAGGGSAAWTGPSRPSGAGGRPA